MWFRIILLVMVLVAPVRVYSDPVVNNVSGSIQHGNTLTVSGSGFGSKNPAAPLLWDDCNSNTNLGSKYDCFLPTNAQQGTSFSMQYREAPFRGVSAPNNRTQYFLAGAHATNSSSDQYSSGGNVALGKNTTSHIFFISYNYRVDPVFDEENHPTSPDNMKELALSEIAGDAYGGTFGYYNWCNNDAPDRNQKNPIRIIRMPIEPANRNLPYGCSGNNQVYHNNPINGWIKMQWEGGYDMQNDAPNIALTTYPDGARTYQSHYGGGLTTDNWWLSAPANPKLNNLKMISIGGFARIPRENNGLNSFRYFASIYMDTTYARVMLGDRPDYSRCTIMEPQIPIIWGDGAISFRVNLGSLPAQGGVYLYVFNANNQHNTQGFSMTIDGNVYPDPPTNLMIIEQ